MHEFAILLFGGLITAKSVDFVRHLVRDMHKGVVLLVSGLIGVGYAFLASYSLYAAWGVSVRSSWVGTTMTGLFMAGIAGGWHELLEVMREWAHRYHGEATEIESRLQRAA